MSDRMHDEKIYGSKRDKEISFHWPEDMGRSLREFALIFAALGSLIAAKGVKPAAAQGEDFWTASST